MQNRQTNTYRMDLSTNYLGLTLSNPIIAGSSGLSGTIDSIRQLADAGVGAIVLKSLFEEQILGQFESDLAGYNADDPTAYEYVRAYSRGSAVDEYLDLVSAAKQATDIPVIASINCVSANEWVAFAKSVEQRGADAIEINVSLLPCDYRKKADQYEKVYFDVLEKVAGMVAIPISLKMSQYSSAIASLIHRLSWTEKVSGFVLFNRYARPDIDIDKERVEPAPIFSNPAEITLPLRWIGLLSGEVKADFAASTGIHDSEGVIKMLLAGAAAVQVVSTLYEHGPQHAAQLIKGLESWMSVKGYDSLAAFQGKLRPAEVSDPAMFERVQFMKYFSGIK